MTMREVPGVEVATEPPEGATDSPTPPPGGASSGGPAAGSAKAKVSSLDRIAEALDGIRTDLHGIRMMMSDRDSAP